MYRLFLSSLVHVNLLHLLVSGTTKSQLPAPWHAGLHRPILRVSWGTDDAAHQKCVAGLPARPSRVTCRPGISCLAARTTGHCAERHLMPHIS